MIVMIIQEGMGMMGRSYFVFLVVLLCGSLVVSLDYRRTREEEFLCKVVDPVTGEVDDNLAHVLWYSCGIDLTRLKEVFANLNLCLPEDTPVSADRSNSRSQLLPKSNTGKLNNVLHPPLKQTLLHCMRRNNLLLNVARGGGSWYPRYLESLFSRPDAPRKNPSTSLARSLAEVSTSASGPARAPATAPAHAPTHSVASEPFFPVDSSPPPPNNENPSANSSSGKNSASNNHIIIAVAVTASVTFVFAALLFLCCSRLCGPYSGDRRNDERPLLSLSLSDYSVVDLSGSVNSVKEEKLGHQAAANSGKFYPESNFMRTSLDESASLGAIGGTAKTSDTCSNVNGRALLPPLKPPPGRIGTTPPGMPPLKPPPGRAVPLSPEPPTSLRPPSPHPPPGPPPPPPPAPPPTKLSGAPCPPRPPPPPMAPGARPGGPPPPPPKGTPPQPSPPLPVGSKAPRPPLGPKHPLNSEGDTAENDAPKTKLKPFFWDKVLANPDHSMVWHQIKSGSFQFNEEMIETLFGYAPNNSNKSDGKRHPSSVEPGPQYIQIIDHKKAQNMSIILRALNVTMEEVCDALVEGNELPAELIETLLKMAPTTDEELKLRLYTGELSQLGPAERFLKALVDIPFAFKRLEALLFMCTLQEEVTVTKESFHTLEVACKELRNCRLFLKLLEAVLKTGNRMNDGTFRGGAQAFKLDTLLKLSDVKGVDGKTTLLHFVVQEIMRSEGVRAARASRESKSFSSVKTEDLVGEITSETDEHLRQLGLEVVSRVSSELESVKKAAALDADSLTGTVSKLGNALLRTRDFLNKDMKNSEEESGFQETLKSFLQSAEGDVTWLLEEEKRIMSLVKSTGDYFHGNSGRDEGLRLFTIVRDFLIMLDKVCKEIRETQKKSVKSLKKEGSTASSSSEPHQQPSPDLRQRLFPAIAERRMNDSSSDEEQ